MALHPNSSGQAKNSKYLNPDNFVFITRCNFEPSKSCLMEFNNLEVLITGGSEGIGFGLAKLFVAAGSKVLITGRSKQKLELAKNKLPKLFIFQNDIGIASERESLAEYATKTLPNLNIVINNAGIQRRIALAEDTAPWEERQKEIDILFSAPVHLNSLIIPKLLSMQSHTLIANVSSGGAYIPQAFAPVYSSMKAALHGYTMVLRHALSETACRVVEIIPPAVKTGLAGPGANHGVDPTEFCQHIFNKLKDPQITSIGFGPTENLVLEFAGKTQEQHFNTSAERFPVKKYHK